MRLRKPTTTLLERFGVSSHPSPTLVETGAVAGRVTHSVAIRCGLPAETPLVLAGPDTQCRLLSMVASGEGQVGIVAG